MAAERGSGPGSENEASEKPVREQLRNATIAGEETSVDTGAAVENGGDNDTDEPGVEPQEMTSSGELQNGKPQEEQAAPARHHTRKRSRDSTAEEDELNNGQRKSGEQSRTATDLGSYEVSNGEAKAPKNVRPQTPEHAGFKRGEAAVEEMTSPKSKKSRLHAEPRENGRAAAKDTEAPRETTEKPSTVEEPLAEDKEAPKLPSTTGFANTSASSPFASLTRSKSPPGEPQQTSSSAFAASGFSSLSGSSTSAFGSIGKTSGGFGTGGSFATGSKSPPPVGTAKSEAAKSDPSSGSTFGGALGQQSTFSAARSNGTTFGFSKLEPSSLGSESTFGSGGFGGFGGFGGGSGLASFASGKPSSGLAGPSKPAKAFGAPAVEDEEGDEAGEAEDESGFKSPLSQDSDKQDERFYEQSLETGEEDEKTEYQCRAKLYTFVAGADGKKEWKERGLGDVRLNVKKPPPDEQDTKPRARLLMRAEGSRRLILNTPVKKEIKFGAPAGGPPQGGYVYFMGAVDGKEGLELLQLKVSS